MVDFRDGVVLHQVLAVVPDMLDRAQIRDQDGILILVGRRELELVIDGGTPGRDVIPRAT